MTRDASTLNCQTTAPNQHREVEILLRDAFTPYVRKLGRELAEDVWLEPVIFDAGCRATGETLIFGSKSTEDL